jgi:hypothetical protein
VVRSQRWQIQALRPLGHVPPAALLGNVDRVLRNMVLPLRVGEVGLVMVLSTSTQMPANAPPAGGCAT